MNTKEKPFVLYKASAGSGKTYTLIKEFLVMCFKHDEKYYKEILAVTFTNKAANEMKAKILNNLKSLMNCEPDTSDMLNDIKKETGFLDDVIKTKAEKLYFSIIHNYSDFNISTIDSFIQQVSRSFAKELNLPSQYKVLLDEDELLEEILQRIDKRIGDNDVVMTEILSEFIEFKLDNEEKERIDKPVKNFVKKLLKEGAYKKGELLNAISLDKTQYDDVKSYLNDKINKLKKSIQDNIKEIEEITLKYQITEECYDGKSKGLINILDKIQKHDNILDVEPSSLINQTIRKILDNENEKDWVHKKAPKDVIEKLNRDNVDVLKAYQKLVGDCNSLYFANMLRNDIYLYVLRGKLMEIVREYIDDTYKVHISEFNKRISDVLGDCSVPFIYERIGARYKHFFIDEFQDTSILQWFNFLPLINNSLSFANKNLLVGDAKQAIYRFRSGEVEQIIKLPKIHQRPDNEFGTDCEAAFEQNWNPKKLETNYRTKENIVKFNNDFFEFSKNRLDNDLYKSVYTDNMRQNFKKKDYDGFVRVEIFKMDCFKEEGKKLPNQSLYRNAVKESILNQITELKEKGYDYKDITILVRRSSDGSDIAEFLTKSQYKIPVISSDSILLKSSDKVMLMVSTLHHLIDENNDVMKLSLSYYNEICNNTNDDVINLTDVVKKMKSINLDLKNTTLSVYDLCAMIAKVYDFNIVEDIFLQYFMNVISEWQNAEHGTLNDFLDYWDRKADTFYVKTPSDIDAVQIMTIHKSKGLEFKIVMYPYAFTQLPDKFKGGEIWLSFKDDFKEIKDMPHIENFILPINKKLNNTIFEKYYVDEKEKASFDDFNIMYVAMTRPKDMLFIYTNDSKPKENNYNLFLDYMEYDKEKYSMRDREGDDEISYVYEVGEVTPNKKDDDVNDDDNILQLDVNQDATTINWTDVVKVEVDPVMISTAEKLYQPQEWGVLVHEILSKIKTKDDAKNVMLPYIYSGSIDEKQAESLLRRFDDIAASEKIKDAYSDDCVVKSEMEILTSDSKIIRPDRYAELDDKVILIDYKTGKRDEKYHEQLRIYASSLNDMNINKKVEAYLVYIEEDKIEIEHVNID